MKNLQTQINDAIQAFTQTLSDLTRRQILESITAAIGSVGGAAKPRRGRPPGVKRAPRATRGTKRDPEALEALTEKIVGAISDNPGSRAEQLSKALGITTKEMVLPIRRLLAAKRLKTKGEKRATQYFIREARSVKAPKVKVTKVKVPRVKKSTRAAAKNGRPPAEASVGGPS